MRLSEMVEYMRSAGFDEKEIAERLTLLTDAGYIDDKERRVPAEIYSRVSGYYRPVNQWNKGKQEEFWERKQMKITGTS